MQLSPDQHRAAVTAEAAALRAAATGAIEASVRACPGWTNAELLDHMGDVYNFIAAQIRSGSADMARPEDAEKGDPLSWFDRGVDLITTALAAADPAQPAWTWGPDDTAEFFFRRMTHETTVHRFDAEQAAGVAITRIDPELARDGINEVIEVGMQHTMRGSNEDFPAGSLHLHCTDIEGEWLLQAADGNLAVTYEHAKGDVAVKGPAQGLYLYIWGRSDSASPDADQLQIFGDEALARAWSNVAP